MSNKDFFRILIKLFAVQSLIAAVFVLLPNSIMYVGMYGDDWLFYMTMMLGSAVVVIVLFYLLVRNPDWVLKALKLDEGFDEQTFRLGAFSPKAIIQIGLVIVGGLLFTDNLISFITNCYFAFQSDHQMLFQFEQEGHHLVTTGLTTLFGYLLFWNHSNIADWILRVKPKSPES